jgi:hypothetical protein
LPYTFKYPFQFDVTSDDFGILQEKSKTKDFYQIDLNGVHDFTIMEDEKNWARVSATTDCDEFAMVSNFF